MLNITARRKQRFCHELLSEVGAVIGFADVGAGGVLKRPWNVLPATHFRKFDFEPTVAPEQKSPLCISNRNGGAQFFVAHDERASSFHRPSPAVVERFGLQSLYPARTIQVECVTLDRYFEDRYDAIDAIDINVEGHDYQVLQGGVRLLETGGIKLLKVEFEVAAVWEGQGWLSDIDPLLRARGYNLAGIDVDFARPVNVRHCFHRGEPLWGKALYVPGIERWNAMLEPVRGDGAAVEHAVAKGVALCVAADIPGQAFDILDFGAQVARLTRLDPVRIKARISAAYRWAKLERGTAELSRLVTRVMGLRRAYTET